MTDLIKRARSAEALNVGFLAELFRELADALEQKDAEINGLMLLLAKDRAEIARLREVLIMIRDSHPEGGQDIAREALQEQTDD